jgi:hypothetical protein
MAGMIVARPEANQNLRPIRRHTSLSAKTKHGGSLKFFPGEAEFRYSGRSYVNGLNAPAKGVAPLFWKKSIKK